MPGVLITGASAGLGAEFARQLAARRADLVLVARSAERLDEFANEIRSEFGVAVEVIAADLTHEADIVRVAGRLSGGDFPIDLLINNAGFGLPLSFADNDIDEEVRHLQIHVETPMRLMHAAINAMRGRGGRILNVASVAGFIPRSTYAASKRWLIGFSEWANVHYRVAGITVTALCPGFTHTDFHERMGLAKGEEGVPRWMWLDAPLVVRQGLRDAAQGRAVSVPSWRYKAIVALTRVIPAQLLAGFGTRGRL